VHIARFLQPLREETAAGEGVTLFGMEIRPSLAVFQTILSAKPKVKPVKDTDRKENRSSNEETPEALSKTGEDVRQPCSATHQSNDVAH
jgi:hypothetical protein